MAAVLSIFAVPNASRSEVVGWHAGRLKVKLKAPAVEGKANEELRRFLAERLGVRPSAVTLERGTAARQKEVRVEGVEQAAAQARLAPEQKR